MAEKDYKNALPIGTILNGQMVDETTVTVKVQSKSAPAPEFVSDHIVDSQPIIDPVPDVVP